MKQIQIRNRKAISPVLATVILIAITLIAAIAIASFAFGLINVNQNVPNLSVKSVACTPSTCILIVQNIGPAKGSITGASFGSPFSPVTVNSNGNSTLTLTGLSFARGQTIAGYLTQGNGPTLYFTATVG
ncbi:MAG: type IV pilin [Candidatus Micrarchaeota archaeon]|nr:type IV pilin [Candidatus Micrarchaeota archaeon]